MNQAKLAFKTALAVQKTKQVMGTVTTAALPGGQKVTRKEVEQK